MKRQAEDDVGASAKRTRRDMPCIFPGCETTVRDRAALKIHIRAHTGERPFACPHEGCTYAAARNAHLKRHMKSHEWDQSIQFRPLICVQQCPVKTPFSSREALAAHVRKAHPEQHASYSALMEQSEMLREQALNLICTPAMENSDLVEALSRPPERG